MDAVYLYNGLYSEKMGQRGVCSQLQTVSRRPLLLRARVWTKLVDGLRELH
jgi:hypothetical protein